MRGDARLRQLVIEEQVAVEHLAAQMRVLAGAGELKPLEDWLQRVRPQPRRTAADMIRVLKEAAGRGARMTIRRVSNPE